MFNFARRKDDNEALVRLMEASEKYDAHWHVDKKVPLAILLGFIIQTSGMIWFAGRLVMRVELLEKYTVTASEVRALSASVELMANDLVTRPEIYAEIAMIRKDLEQDKERVEENKADIYILRDRILSLQQRLIELHPKNSH